MKKHLKSLEQHSDNSAMETGDHSKNGVSPKNLSRERHSHPAGMHRSVEQHSTLSLHSAGMHPCLINLWMHPCGMHNGEVIALLPSVASRRDANRQNNSLATTSPLYSVYNQMCRHQGRTESGKSQKSQKSKFRQCE